ncbi:MAG: glycogen synthase GlgA [Deferrisomatales bacterium]
MKVWMVGTEMAPYAKVGGLGDVLGALPQALARIGCDVTVILPHLASIDAARWGLSPTGVSVRALIDGQWQTAEVLEANAPGTGRVRVLFLHHPAYFHREGLYGTPAGDFPDNAQRFAFLCYAALEAGARCAPQPDVVHSHDWQAGLVPFFLKAPEHYGSDPRFAGAVRVHTIHNLSYQGLFPAEVLPRLGISWAYFHHLGLEFYGLVNFLKAGLVYADVLTTVSPTYAREIQTFDFAWGLHGVLVERAADLHGILNGIDDRSWDPGNDGALVQQYSRGDLAARKHNTRALRAELGLPRDGRPLAGVVNRLVQQKGIDLLLGLEPHLEGLGLQWAILGSGETGYEAAVVDLVRRHPGTVAARIGFDDGVARRIYAGSDLFCMPSLFEPCGLGQMIALRYGSIPVVRRTGGLADTVRDVATPEGVGFVFEEPSPAALEGALERARVLLANPSRTAAVRRRGMAMDYSWNASAGRYLEVYRQAAGRRPHRPLQ